MMKWLFFDMGSTLVDERDCIEYRISETLKQPNAPAEKVFRRRIAENAKNNKMPYKDTAKEFGCEIVEWPHQLEKLYSGTPDILEKLSGKYKLGIIANQSLGTEERLRNWGIRDIFEVVIASAEAGVSKPNPAIFEMALQQAGCRAKDAWMIGDRLDNDIAPAAKLGMHTIWVKQGWARTSDLEKAGVMPEIMVESIREILDYL